MSRKSSLIYISKAYEQVLNEMNISGVQNPQNTIPMDKKQIEFVVQKTPEQMQRDTSKMDANRKQCSKCKSSGCREEGEEYEENCEDCDGGCGEKHDPNIDMAKSEIYNILKNAEKMMHTMKKKHKMEAWMLSKIIKAADYLSSVSDVLEYDEYEKEVNQPCDDFSNDIHLVTKITSMLNGEGRQVNEEILKRIIFNLELLKEI